MTTIKPTVTKYSGPICRGSWALGNNCKVCARCLETKPKQAKANPMTTIEPTRRDKDVAAHAWSNHLMRSGPCEDWFVRSYAHHAAAERAIGYRMGIEAAAKVASEWHREAHIGGEFLASRMAARIETTIRALSDNAEAIARGE